jgi:hypothetical protein
MACADAVDVRPIERQLREAVKNRDFVEVRSIVEVYCAPLVDAAVPSRSPRRTVDERAESAREALRCVEDAQAAVVASDP